jgi:hypothetical protein
MDGAVNEHNLLEPESPQDVMAFYRTLHSRKRTLRQADESVIEGVRVDDDTSPEEERIIRESLCPNPSYDQPGAIGVELKYAGVQEEALGKQIPSRKSKAE